MRTTRLARVAAEAQILLLRRQATVGVRRAIYGAVAAVFGLYLLATLHVLGAILLHRIPLDWLYVALILLGIDLVIVLVFALLASGKAEDPLVTEARTVRDQSIKQLRDQASASAILLPAGRLLGRKHIYGLALAALTARFLGARR